MGTTQCAARTVAAKETSQYEITSNIITKLNNFKLTPTAKLVLLYLTTCYNPKHADVFPKQKTIADKLGVSERSITRAIQELFKEGLVLIECKYTNRYKFTSNIINLPPRNEDLLSSDNKSDAKCKNVTLQTDNLSRTCIEQIKETKKEQTVINKGGNVYSGDDEILADYAVKHNAKNINAYIAKLKETKSAEKIIKEYKQKRFIKQRAENEYKRSQEQIRLYESYKKDAVPPETCPAWVELSKKIRSYRNSANALSV